MGTHQWTFLKKTFVDALEIMLGTYVVLISGANFLASALNSCPMFFASKFEVDGGL